MEGTGNLSANVINSEEIQKNNREVLEARAGIEPAHKGFADLSLTTWVPRLGEGDADCTNPLKLNGLLLPPLCGWSGRRDLNSRPSPWQGDALPLSYSRLTQV